MIRALYREGPGQISVDLRPEAYVGALQDKSSVLWVDMSVGFFGMNSFQPVVALEAWTERLALGLTLAGRGFTPMGMYLWMRRRGWWWHSGE